MRREDVINLILRFNSTRWISNVEAVAASLKEGKVSTPHGGLATKLSRLKNAIKNEVSTPHGGLATRYLR